MHTQCSRGCAYTGGTVAKLRSCVWHTINTGAAKPHADEYTCIAIHICKQKRMLCLWVSQLVHVHTQLNIGRVRANAP